MKKMDIHCDFAVVKDCKNLEDSYGEICVKCNKCGRFDEKERDVQNGCSKDE